VRRSPRSSRTSLDSRTPEKFRVASSLGWLRFPSPAAALALVAAVFAIIFGIPGRLPRSIFQSDLALLSREQVDPSAGRRRVAEDLAGSLRRCGRAGRKRQIGHLSARRRDLDLRTWIRSCRHARRNAPGDVPAGTASDDNPCNRGRVGGIARKDIAPQIERPQIRVDLNPGVSCVPSRSYCVASDDVSRDFDVAAFRDQGDVAECRRLRREIARDRSPGSQCAGQDLARSQGGILVISGVDDDGAPRARAHRARRTGRDSAVDAHLPRSEILNMRVCAIGALI